MKKTPIDWVKNPDGTPGYTWNPITGCLNHNKGMCKGGNFPCYAYKLANGRLKQRYLANDNYVVFPPPHPSFDITIPKQALTDPFYPRFWEDRLYQPLFLKKPSGIFVCDMGELFGDWIPSEWQKEIFLTITCNPRHRFYLLTKQPQNLIKWSPFPGNCWVGVTVTDDDMMIRALDYLKGIEAKVKYLSVEPFLGQINTFWLDVYLRNSGINQVIFGAQTKPYKPPKIEWIQEITKACDKASIPVFHKDNLKPIFPVPTNTLRQEMPK